ncbi:MAG TPA: formyltransferase [Steroidobacteraceae bacterium]|nr:formyltransferase [Steroidobacteraceae bacterium]HRX89349.1 formyltransferase [Steroidobacteraceae bacterium]
MKPTAVVFAYSEVGVRCLEVLLAAQVDVSLVVTHDDDPNETRWFASVAELAEKYRLACIAPASVADAALQQRVAELAPDFIFSFYYRFLLGDALLECARRGALNIHGSLLPKFRGRAPVNWAILRGATETGATLHYMVARADAGNIVDQQAVPIGEDDDALTVFRRVSAAAETILARSLSRLIDGSAPSIPQPILPGEYFGRRRPEDGRIDWSRPARVIHNLVRAVAPPYPGAFTFVNSERWQINRTKVLAERCEPAPRLARLTGVGGLCIADCVDGGRLLIVAAQADGGPIDLVRLAAELERAPLQLSP